MEVAKIKSHLMMLKMKERNNKWKKVTATKVTAVCSLQTDA